MVRWRDKNSTKPPRNGKWFRIHQNNIILKCTLSIYVLLSLSKETTSLSFLGSKRCCLSSSINSYGSPLFLKHILLPSSQPPPSSSLSLSFPSTLTKKKTKVLPTTSLCATSNSKSKGFSRGAMSRKKTLDSKRLQKDQDKENNSSSSSNEISSKVEQSARTAISTKAMVRTTDDPNGASKIYSLPALYDMAFGYRNFESEVDFLVYAHQLHSSPDEKTGPYSILELAAGPARHSLTALINHDCPITHCHAIDLSSDMATYSQELALELVKDEMTRSSFAYSIMNMCNLNPFSLLQKHPENAHHDTDITNNEKSPCPLPPSLQLYDSAWLLLGSMQHILTNKEAISTFQSIASVVHTGGTLIVELPHPRELFRLMECTRNGWEIPLEGEDGKEEGELRIVWGDDDDRFDPILQQRDFTVELTLVETETATTSSSSKKKHKEVITQHVKEVVPMRLFTAQELDILATASGCWKLEKMYGALDEEVLIENDDLAFRMVCVFQRV